jgi:hypothetical protein
MRVGNTGGEIVATADLAARFEKLPDLVNGDVWLVHRGRFLSVDVLIGLGATPYYLTIEHGRIIRLERGPSLMRSWRLALRAEESGWRRHWEAVPEPHFHDLLAMAKRGALAIEGDVRPFMANLFYFKDVLAAPRQRAGTG